MIFTPISLALAVALSPGPEPDPAPVKVLDAVVVVGSRTAEPIRQVVGTITRVDREQIEQRGVQTLDDLARLVPGMEVASDPNRFGALGFNLRGLDGNRVSVELDGIPLADGFGVGQFALAGRDLVELGVVDRVEVLRGPASTLYGSKALAGVVAFWTPDAADANWRSDDQRLLWSLRTGAASRDDSRWLSARAVARSGDARVTALLALGRRQGQETQNNARTAEDAANPADFSSETALAKFGFDAGEAGRWTATLEQGRGERQTDVQSQLFGPGRFATTYALLADDRYRRDRISLASEWDAVGPLGPVRALVYRQSSRSEQWSDQFRLADRATPFASRRERGFIFEQVSTGLELTAQWRGEAGGFEHWQVFGVDIARHEFEGLRDGLETNLATGASTPVIIGEVFPLRDFPNTRATELGLFWQDEIRFAGAWALVPGLRWEHYQLDARPDPIWREDNPAVVPVSLDSSRVTPKLGLRWSGERLGVYAQYARGYRAPPFGDVNIGLNLPAFNYIALPNPALRPETSDGYELGLRWAGDVLQASVAVYENRFEDLIESRANLGRNDAGQLVFQSINRDRARIRGAELEARWYLDGWLPSAPGWYVDLSAAWSRGDDTARDQPLNSVPPGRASLAAGYDAPDGRWGSELRLTGVRGVDRADQTAGALYLPPGYSSWDANAWLAIGDQLRLNLSLHNLADRRYWDWSTLRGLAAGADDIDFYSRPGRGASLGLRLEF
ncbi:TonB-dependent receptor domain-containing protein [Arenimonas alkanexedens]